MWWCTWKEEAEDGKIKASLGYTVRLSQKKKSIYNICLTSLFHVFHLISFTVFLVLNHSITSICIKKGKMKINWEKGQVK
jgi:hypothetical protein